ncbi:MAG: lipid-A-disaccharide synthase, partial [Bacteroidota bacterium]
QFVCYRGNPISYHIARWLVKVKYISLVNLVMDSECVTELIQQDLNLKNLDLELRKILSESSERSRMLSDYNRLIEMLGGNGASKRAASIILQDLAGVVGAK